MEKEQLSKQKYDIICNQLAQKKQKRDELKNNSYVKEFITLEKEIPELEEQKREYEEEETLEQMRNCNHLLLVVNCESNGLETTKTFCCVRCELNNLEACGNNLDREMKKIYTFLHMSEQQFIPGTRVFTPNQIFLLAKKLIEQNPDITNDEICAVIEQKVKEKEIELGLSPIKKSSRRRLL